MTDKKRRLQLTFCIEVLQENCNGCPHKHSDRSNHCKINCGIGKKLYAIGQRLGDSDEVKLPELTNKKGHGHWSDDEVDYLIEHYGKVGRKTLAVHIGRSVGSVGSKISKLLELGLLEKSSGEEQEEYA